MTSRLRQALSGVRTGERINLEALRPARPVEHPVWCNVQRCLSPYADPVGGHRSDPLAVPVPGLGKAILTLTQRLGGRVHIEATVVAAAPVADAAAQLAFAQQVLADLAETVGTSAELARLTEQRDQLLAGRTAIGR